MKEQKNSYQDGEYTNGNYNQPVLLGCYSSIISQSNVEVVDNMYEYMAKFKVTNNILPKKYFTALARERYSMYKTNNDPDKLKQNFIKQ